MRKEGIDVITNKELTEAARAANRPDIERAIEVVMEIWPWDEIRQ